MHKMASDINKREKLIERSKSAGRKDLNHSTISSNDHSKEQSMMQKKNMRELASRKADLEEEKEDEAERLKIAHRDKLIAKYGDKSPSKSPAKRQVNIESFSETEPESAQLLDEEAGEEEFFEEEEEGELESSGFKEGGRRNLL